VISDSGDPETYSMVGRSLPLAFLCVWVKYRERGGADYGEEGFRDTRLAVVAGLKSRIELLPKGV
jgi:hypothetical protein